MAYDNNTYGQSKAEIEALFINGNIRVTAATAAEKGSRIKPQQQLNDNCYLCGDCGKVHNDKTGCF